MKRASTASIEANTTASSQRSRWWQQPLWITCLLFVPLAVLIALMQKITSREGVLEMYMNVTGEEIYSGRLFPRFVILAIHGSSLGRVGLPHANYLLQFSACWGALVFLFLFARGFLSPMTALAATFVGALYTFFGFLQLGASYAYPYDLVILFMSVAGLWAIVTSRYVVLLIIVAAGTLTKETMIWILAAYFMYEVFHMGNSRRLHALLLARTLALCLVFLVAYFLPRMYLGDSSHGAITVSPTVDGEPRFLLNLRELLFLVDRGGFVQNVYLGLSLYVLPIAFFRWLPRPLQSIYGALPIFILPNMFFSNIADLRLLNEVIPIGAVGTALILERLWQRVPTTTSP